MLYSKPRCSLLRLSDVEGLFLRVEQLENAFAESHNQLPPRLGSSRTERPASPLSDIGDDTVEPEESTSPSTLLDAAETTDSPLTLVSIEAQPSYHSLGQNPAMGVPLTQYWYSRGIPLLSDRGRRYIHSKTGQDSVVEKLRFPPRLHPPAQSVCCSDKELWKLPPKETVRNLVLNFLNSQSQRRFPVLDHLLFNATLEEAYGFIRETPSSSQIQSIACVLATLSFIDSLQCSNKSISSEHADTYATKAQCILKHMINVETSVVSLQTVLTLQRYYMSSTQTDKAAYLHSIACHIVCALGGHTYVPSKHDGPDLTWAERQGHHLRTLFWICFMFDKDLSLRSAQAPLLTEEYCDLTIPECCTGCYTTWQMVGANKKYHFCIPGDPALLRLKEKISRLLFSPRALKLNDGELVLRIRQLDDDLESWRLSVPSEIRPKLSIPSFQWTPTQEPYATMNTTCRLQLEYHHLVTAIHTAVRRCGANNPDHRDLPDDIHNVIHSSCDLSLEASRSTMTFMQRPTTLLGDQDFGDIIFYLTLAAVSLFIEILAHPQKMESQNALDYLASSIDIVQSISTPALTQTELDRIQETTRFIVELIDLGTCAIQNVTRDAQR
ncbi:hypothetical protein NPX13_g1553 [Xylaria arbuscula]|uniref:Xylanolytic transcriptional activator regulatory domain-containing protein n=1 Tax=Xylaria arbuscula TaxID=114810 RepID=A0A9W8NM51_9PEZI|nr:hypothetical protein NPX13_g1553 [Xylaria arbuscula]